LKSVGCVCFDPYISDVTPTLDETNQTYLKNLLIVQKIGAYH